MRGNWIRSLGIFAAAALALSPAKAFGQFDDILDRVRQGAGQVSPNNPTYYLKSAKAVEPNVCLYSNGDPTGVLGPLIFKNSYVATPNCKDFSACTDIAAPVDEPKPLDCGAEIPNSAYWSPEQKVVNLRSDGSATIEFESHEFVRVRSCTERRNTAFMCTTGNVGLFRAEVEYEYPSGDASRYNWDRFQNLAGRRMEAKTRLTWNLGQESRRTGNRRGTTVTLAGVPSSIVPAHDVTAKVSYRFGDRQAEITFVETNEDLQHYAELKTTSDGSQVWEVRSEIFRRPSPPVSKVSFNPTSYMILIEDKELPDLTALPGSSATRTKYLVTVYTEKKHKDESLIFQTEAENASGNVLFSLPMDREALLANKGKSRKIRVHVRAQRIGSPWVDGAVSSALTYETPKDVKFPKK